MTCDASPPIFSVRSLSKRYGSTTVVNDLSFSIAPGECLGVIGPNGAGKTTTIRMCLGLATPDGGDFAAQRLVAGALAQQGAQVVAGLGEEAGVELAFGRQADAGAAGAEGLGHRGDDADFAAAVGVAPAFGDFAGVVGIDGGEREFGMDAGDDLGRRQHLVHAPAVR